MQIEDLYKKYPFIYRISGGYFYIGFGICKECNSKIAISYYEDYFKCIDNIGEKKILDNDNSIAEDEMDRLLYFFRKVKAYSDIAVDENERSSFRNKINQYIDEINEEDRKELEHQLKLFVGTFRYYYKRWKV